MKTITIRHLKALQQHTPDQLGQPIVRRVERTVSTGGLARPHEKPLAWAMEIPIAGIPHELYSIRGERREWTDLNRIERYLREIGIREWGMLNEQKA